MLNPRRVELLHARQLVSVTLQGPAEDCCGSLPSVPARLTHYWQQLIRCCPPCRSAASPTRASRARTPWWRTSRTPASCTRTSAAARCCSAARGPWQVRTVVPCSSCSYTAGPSALVCRRWLSGTLHIVMEIAHQHAPGYTQASRSPSLLGRTRGCGRNGRPHGTPTASTSCASGMPPGEAAAAGRPWAEGVPGTPAQPLRLSCPPARRGNVQIGPRLPCLSALQAAHTCSSHAGGCFSRSGC